jgi:hypothetical protein
MKLPENVVFEFPVATTPFAAFVAVIVPTTETVPKPVEMPFEPAVVPAVTLPTTERFPLPCCMPICPVVTVPPETSPVTFIAARPLDWIPLAHALIEFPPEPAVTFPVIFIVADEPVSMPAD